FQKISESSAQSIGRSIPSCPRSPQRGENLLLPSGREPSFGRLEIVVGRKILSKIQPVRGHGRDERLRRPAPLAGFRGTDSCESRHLRRRGPLGHLRPRNTEALHFLCA